MTKKVTRTRRPWVGDYIRDYRREAELDQDEFGKLCGLSVTTVSNLERGIVKATERTLQALASGMGIDYGGFVAGVINKKRHEPSSSRRRRRSTKAALDVAADAAVSANGKYDADEKLLLVLYRLLDKRVRKEFLHELIETSLSR